MHVLKEIQKLTRIGFVVHLMYSNLHIHTIAPKALTHQSHSFSISVWSVFTGSVIRSPAKSKSNHDDDAKKNRTERTYSPWHTAKHPKCSYRLFTACSRVRALAFQKCTVNLIIQIENNWINQPRNHL